MDICLWVWPTLKITQYQPGTSVYKIQHAWSITLSLIWYSHIRKSFFPFLFLFSFHWRSILNNYNTSLGIGVGPASQSWTYVGMIARCVLKHNIMNLTNNCVCLHGFSKLFSVLISRTNHLFIHRIIQIFISPQKC